MDIEKFLYYFVFNETLNLSYERYKVRIPTNDQKEKEIL